jgi:hypothetical protein
VYTFVIVAWLIDVKEELDDDHDHENEIDKKFDEARGVKLKYN